jgi:hypothetical protein
MAHECDDCGGTFETLSSLRLHDCPASTDSTDEDDFLGSEWLEERGESRQRERKQLADRVVSDAFTDAIDRAQAGDAGAAATVLAQYERELTTALDRDDGGDTFRAVFWTYYKPTVEAVDAVARENGWSFLLDITGAYDHREEGALLDVTAVIANLVARGVIRTRLTAGVEEVPLEALEYLGTIAEFDTEAFEIAWEESQHVGWGVGHPEYPLAETLQRNLPEEDIWAGAAALRALYADQHAGVSLYCDVLRGAEDPGLVLDRLAHFEGEPSWELFPRSWDVEAEFDRDFTFSFDEPVEQELREAIEGTGYVARLPEDWSFENLELRW